MNLIWYEFWLNRIFHFHHIDINFFWLKICNLVERLNLMIVKNTKLKFWSIPMVPEGGRVPTKWCFNSAKQKSQRRDGGDNETPQHRVLERTRLTDQFRSFCYSSWIPPTGRKQMSTSGWLVWFDKWLFVWLGSARQLPKLGWFIGVPFRQLQFIIWSPWLRLWAVEIHVWQDLWFATQDWQRSGWADNLSTANFKWIHRKNRVKILSIWPALTSVIDYRPKTVFITKWPHLTEDRSMNGCFSVHRQKRIHKYGEWNTENRRLITTPEYYDSKTNLRQVTRYNKSRNTKITFGINCTLFLSWIDNLQSHQQPASDRPVFPALPRIIQLGWRKI